MNQFTLTKEEFITRAMAGEVFIHVPTKTRLFYDNTKSNPFRADGNTIVSSWDYFNREELFTLEQPKPRIERRWKWRKDYSDYTEEPRRYYSDTRTSRLKEDGWYKVKDCFIDVEIKK